MSEPSTTAPTVDLTPHEQTEKREIESAEDLLAAALEVKLGEVVEPRPGQKMLCVDVAEVMDNARLGNSEGVHLAGRAKTGTGKSMGYLAPAMFAAAARGERTVVSTKDLALQRQIVDTDSPHINAALVDDGYSEVPVAVLKGFSNYTCPRSALLSVSDIADRHVPENIAAQIGKRVSAATHKLADGQMANDSEVFAAEIAKTMSETIRALDEATPAGTRSYVTDAGEVGAVETLKFLNWTAEQGMISEPHRQITDISDYPDKLDWQVRSLATQQKTDCPKDCPLQAICPPNLSRERAAMSDVIVTNHTFLAIQATADAPIIVSNKTIGQLDHLIVDEAHDLASITRSQAQSTLSGPVVSRLAKAAARCIDDIAVTDPILSKASGLATMITSGLSDLVGRKKGDVTIGEDTDPTEAFRASLDEWIINTRAVLSAHKSALSRTKTSTADMRKIDRIASVRRQLAELRVTLIDCGKHRVGRARWIGQVDYQKTTIPTLNVSAVDVGYILPERVFTGYEPAESMGMDEPIESDDDADADKPDVTPQWRLGEPYPLSVTCVSATLSEEFPREVGLDATIVDYPSVFDDAYERSALFSPRVDPDDDDALAPEVVATERGWGGKSKFKIDYDKHRQWCANAIVKMVRANRGAALVLATNAANGRAYAQRLREDLGADITVLDQWTGAGSTALTRQFKDDSSSVLVATRGWMTGVDVPGDALSLVIIDRIPRAPANAVDDARAELIGAAGGNDFVRADRVYGSDAAVLLEQAFGRLIRSTNDSGMVALLDPRVSPKSILTNRRAPSYQYYKTVFSEFGSKFSALDDALGWLHDASAGRGED